MPKLAILQTSITDSLERNLETAERMVRQAASQGAQIILLPELFENVYFCQLEREEYFALAHPVSGHPFIGRFQALAAELKVVLPISFFEAANQTHFNSLAMIDADGTLLGVYRKSHIPDGPGYEEKYYFNGGDTGFKTWSTRYGKIGVGICWDQWFPEAARVMSLLGADLLLYPTAIGSEPAEVASPNSHNMWQRAMLGHAVCNSIYLAAANRTGLERIGTGSLQVTQTYYGHSFICDYQGEMLQHADDSSETVLLSDLDFEAARVHRAGMGFFRDRRPELYRPLLTLDGGL